MARASWSSTRARRCTRSTGPRPCSPATTGTVLLVLPFTSRARAAAAGWPSWATPRAPPRAPTDASSRATRIDGVELDSELSEIGRALLRHAQPAADHAPRGRAAVPAPGGHALRRDRGGCLPPALHPVLPDHRGVLRPGARPGWTPGGVGHHQRGPARGRGPSWSGCSPAAGRGPPSHMSSATRSRTPTLCWWQAAHRCRRPTSGRAIPSLPRAVRRHRPARRPTVSGGRCKAEAAYTDDRAPVEWLVDKSIVDYAADDD